MQQPHTSFSLSLTHTHSLTNDLLAVFDQHFLNDGAELFDGFDGLRGERKHVVECEKSF